ncbi:MAG: TetR/AcrR family transcriptional regulator [Actinomycetaceae bacterium]|nr:TetR/AcrR family transcriptional regulator [Actinomycetaceae bacterium]
MTRRVDAQRNYQAILTAAEQVFAEHSPECPLQLVAEAAGVGRGTLYRHFPDRISLVAALYETRMQRYNDFVTENAQDPDVLFKLLRLVALDQIRIPGLYQTISSSISSNEYLNDLWQRTQDLFIGPLEVANKGGKFRCEMTIQEVFLAVSMLHGVANSPQVIPHDEVLVDHAIAVLRRGLEKE